MLSDDNEARRAQLNALVRLIANHFSLEEINSIFVELYPEAGESVPGDTIINRAQNLVNYCRRRGEIEKLIKLALEQRPNAPWLNVLYSTNQEYKPTYDPQNNMQEGDTKSSESNSVTSSTKSPPEFVNRTSELWEVCSPSSIHYHFIIDAPPGYGKSRFLNKIADYYKTNANKDSTPWLIAYVDLSKDEFKTDDQVFAAIASQWISEPSEPIQSFIDLAAALSKCNSNFILLVDSCHSKPSFANYIYEKIFSFITKRLENYVLRLIFSGRNMHERIYPWPNFKYLTLTPFDETAVTEFITSSLRARNSTGNGRNPYTHVQDILMLSGGHPEAIEALVNEVINKLNSAVFWEDDRQGIFERCIRPLRLVDRILESQTAFKQHELLKKQLSTISIFRIFNATTIRAIRERSLVDATFIGDRLNFIQKLTNLGIARAADETYSSSEGVRNVILAEMKVTDPDSYISLHHVAHNLYNDWINGIGLNGLPNDGQLLLFIKEAIYHFLETKSTVSELDVISLIQSYIDKSIRSIHGEEGIPVLKKKLASQLLRDEHIRLRLKQLNQLEQVQNYLQQLSNSEFNQA